MTDHNNMNDNDAASGGAGILDEDAQDGLAVTPPDPHAGSRTPSSDAGTDESIAERLKRNPESKEARLDRALDESMDASDPPSSTQPVHRTD